MRANMHSNEQKMAYVADFLKGRSNRWWWNARRQRSIDTWEKFVDELRKHACDVGVIEDRICVFHDMAQQDTQSDREWAVDLEEAHKGGAFRTR